MSPALPPPPRILVAGIGNIFFGDDGFGAEVARRLCARALPAGVRAVDFGIRGLDLGYALSGGEYDAAILVDAAPRGGAPGTLYVITPALPDGASSGLAPSSLDAHSVSPVQALAMAAAMGPLPRWVRVLGCEPAALAGDDGEPAMGLSPSVAAAVEPAVAAVLQLAAQAAQEAGRA